MLTAPGSVRPRPGPEAVAPRLLWLGAPGGPWQPLSQAARALGCEAVQAVSLASAGVELSRARPTLVLVDWRRVLPGSDLGLMGLRARAGAAGVPVAVVAEADTPPEVLEAAEAEGVDDCLLAPLLASGLEARLAALGGGLPVASARHSPRVVLLVGASSGRAWSGLGALLEACGHHLLYSATSEGAAARVAEHGAAPHLVLVPADAFGAQGRPLSLLTRAQPLLEGVPALSVAVGGGPAAVAALLPRLHALLGRDQASLRAETRRPFCCPVEFSGGGPRPSEWQSGFSSALSPGGVLVRTLVPARPGMTVALRILLPTSREQLEAHGVVAWANPFVPRGPLSYPYGMGVRFLGMGPPRLMRLRQLCQPAASP